MKKYSSSLILFLIVVVLITSCGGKEDGIYISGEIANPITEGAVVISEYQADGLVPVDTIEVQDDGSFKGHAKVTGPVFYKVDFQGRKSVNLILNGTEKKVKIELDLEGTESPMIEGAPEALYVMKYDELVKGMQEDQEMLNQEAMQARMNGDQLEFQKISDEYMILIKEFNENVKTYSKSIAPSLAVFYGVSVLKPEEHPDFYIELSEIYGTELPDHFLTKDLKKTADYLSSRAESMTKLAIGAPAPEISLPTPNGEIITLSSLKGNYVLIDFWAGWCRPCRMENPNVVRLYKKYQDKNFEILGVSLDRNKESWVKAIEQDGLVWKHVSDLSYFNSEAAQTYQINSIPATYLIGPDGKIIAKGLRGPSLEAKLKEIFG